MRMHIHTSGFDLTQAMNIYIRQRAMYALSRFDNEIKNIAVHLTNGNGPKSGTDKSCLVRIKAGRLPEIIVKDVQRDLYIAIDRALARAKDSLAKRLERARAFTYRLPDENYLHG